MIMPRRPRVLLADYPLHIVQRGINREPDGTKGVRDI